MNSKKEGLVSYVGTVEVFRRFISWNILDLLSEKNRVRIRHINRHGYMRRSIVRGGGDAA